MRKYYALAVALAGFCSFNLFAQQEVIKASDVQKMMGELLEKHLGNQEISEQLLLRAVSNYLETFDRDRLYLIQSEFNRWQQLPKNELDELMTGYKSSNFSDFRKLDELIRSSIMRQRQWRTEFTHEADALFETAKALRGKKVEGYDSFASTKEELKERVRGQLVAYISRQFKRYGEKDILQNKKAVFENFEAEEREYEAPYLNELSKQASDTAFHLRLLKALAMGLDAHTSVYNSEEAYDMKTKLEKSLRGVGLVVYKEGGAVFVDKIISDSPAAKQGSIQVGDRLVEINGQSTATMPINDILDLLRGESATQVHLVLKRKGGISDQNAQQLYNVDLTPTLITLTEGRVEMSYVPFENGIIGTIVLRSFYRGAKGVNSENDVREALQKLEAIAPLKGLILDLRGNMGGFLTQAVKVSGLFLTSGVVVISKYANGEERFYRDMDGKAFYQGPLVVLTSKTTASAAEIVAQALQDYGVALVVGDQHTYGKGTIQNQTITGDQPHASYFKVTVGKYYTVSGKTPQKMGVKADIPVLGELSLQELGEEFYPNAPDPDFISPAYQDPLNDVSSDLKPWFDKNYSPVLQQKEQLWAPILPELKRRSAIRLQQVPAYQRLIDRIVNRNQGVLPSKGDIEKWRTIQHDESVNIVKDMISLEPNEKK